MIVFLLRLKTGDRVFTNGKEIFVVWIVHDRPALREPTEEEAEEITRKLYDEGREGK